MSSSPLKTPSRSKPGSLNSKLSIETNFGGAGASRSEEIIQVETDSEPKKSSEKSSEPSSTSSSQILNVPTTETTPNKLRRRGNSTTERPGSGSKRNSMSGLGSLVRRTTNKIIGSSSDGTKVRPVTPSRAPPTPPPSSRGTPSSTPLSRIPRPQSGSSKLSSSSSRSSIVSNEFDEHPLSLSVDVVTPPTAMSLHMQNSAATEYFATVEPIAPEPTKEATSVEVTEVNADEEEKIEPQFEETEKTVEAVVKEEASETPVEEPVKRESGETGTTEHEVKENREELGEDKDYVQVGLDSSITLPPKGEESKDAPKESVDEDAEEQAGARAIEEARSALEALDSKPPSPHTEIPYSRSESFSHVPTAEDSAKPKDEDEVSIISDIQRPRVSETISRIERDIEVSSAAASPRARTDSYGSMRSPSSFSARFRRESSEFSAADESFESVESTGSTSGSNLKRPLSRSYSVSSTITMASAKLDNNNKSYEQSFDNLFSSSPPSVASPTSSIYSQSTQVFTPETPTPSGNVEKRRKPSGQMTTVLSPNGEKKPRFASPTMASQTRERITRKTFHKNKSESHITPSKLPRRATDTASIAGSIHESMQSPGDTPQKQKIVVKLPPAETKKDEGVMTEPMPEEEEEGTQRNTTTMTVAPHYASQGVQTEYPSPPSSPFTFRSYSPVGRSRSASRALEGFESFQQSIDDAAGVDSKMAALIAMYDDAKTVDDLVESMENSMDLLEGSFRASTPPHYLLMNGRANSGLTTMENSQMLPPPSTSAGAEDTTAVALITNGKDGMNLSVGDMSNLQLLRHAFGRNKWNLLWTFVAIIFLLIAYYMQLVRIHRACGFADTYICTSGGRVCMMRPYQCY